MGAQLKRRGSKSEVQKRAVAGWEGKAFKTARFHLYSPIAVRFPDPWEVFQDRSGAKNVPQAIDPARIGVAWVYANGFHNAVRGKASCKQVERCTLPQADLLFY